MNYKTLVEAAAEEYGVGSYEFRMVMQSPEAQQLIEQVAREAADLGVKSVVLSSCWFQDWFKTFMEGKE